MSNQVFSIIYLPNGSMIQMLEPWLQVEHESGRITLSDVSKEYLGTIYPNGMVQMSAACKHRHVTAEQIEKSLAFTIVSENIQKYDPASIKKLKNLLTKFDSHKKTWKK